MTLTPDKQLDLLFDPKLIQNEIHENAGNSLHVRCRVLLSMAIY